MPRPIVEVLQTVANITTTVNDPEQSVLLVGPQYDLTAFDRDNPGSALAEYNPYTGTSVMDFNTGNPYNFDIDISDRGSVDTAAGSEYAAKVYLTNAYFQVGGGTSVVAPAANSDANVGALRTQLSFPENLNSVGGYSVLPNDKVVISFKQASRFVASAGVEIGEAYRSPASVSILPNHVEAAAFDGSQVDLFYSEAQHGLGSASELLLSDKTKDSFFSKTDGADPATLSYPAGTEVTLRLTDAEGNHSYVQGTLAIPEDQITTVVEASAQGSTLQLADIPRQLCLGGGDAADDAVRGLSVRIERLVSAEYDIPLAGLEIASSEWAIDGGDLNMQGIILLEDTNIPGAANLSESTITRGDLYLRTRTLNTQSSALALTVSSNDFQDVLGEPSVYNPLSLAASIALQNSGSSTVKVLRLAEDSSQGYLDARSYINADPDAYAIIPLTTDLSVINSLVTDAVVSSEQKYNFRIVIGASEGAPLRKYWAGSDSEYLSGRISSFEQQGQTTTAELLDADASFLASVSDGDLVEFYFDSDADVLLKATVTSVSSNSTLQLTLTEGNIAAVGAIKFIGYADISSNKAEQVAVLNDRISTFSSQKRLVMVYPGSCTVLGESGQPGYYLGAALGGMLAAFEPHRPKNNIAISGIDNLAASNLGYFNDDQIDSLSDNGYFVFVQETTGGLPFCVHQVTCAYRDFAGTQEFSELSVVNNFDYVSKVFKNTLTPYVGTWNVIPQALASIASSLDSAILSLRARVVDRIGAPLRDADIISVEESPSDAGTVVILLNVSLPKVLNKIQITLESQ